MNILFVNNVPFNPQYGGIERVTDLLAKCLIRDFQYNIYYLICEECVEKYLSYDFPAPIYCLSSQSNIEEKQKFLSQLVTNLSIDVIINQRGQSYNIHKIVSQSGAKIISVLHSQPTAWIKHEMFRTLATDLSSPLGWYKHLLKILFYPLYYMNIVF